MERPGLQERYLNAVRKENITATFFLVNGFQLKGSVVAFDSYTVLILCGNKQELIFKHAISTIIPEKTVDLTTVDN